MALTNGKVLELIKTLGHAEAAKLLIENHKDVFGENVSSVCRQLRRVKAPKKSKDNPEYVAWTVTSFPISSCDKDKEVLSPIIINLWNV